MVNSKFWWTCEECKKKMRNTFEYKGLFLCYHCYSKLTTNINSDLIYGERFTKKFSFGMILTKTQYKRMLEKITKLYGNSNYNIAPYLRELLLRDLKDDD